MSASVIEDRGWMAEPRLSGAARWDEVWDGVLHAPPEPTSDHQRFEARLERRLVPLELALSTVAGPKLHVASPDGAAEI
jgi:hypothetical protein